MSIVVRRLTEDLVHDLILSPPVPHRHAFQEVVLLTEGGGTHEIDGELHAVAAPMAILIAKGKQHLLLPLPTARGWIINFDEDQLPPYGNWIFSQFFSVSNLSLGSGPECHAVLKLAALMQDLQASASTCTESVLTHLLLAMLNLLQSEVRGQVLLQTEAGRGEFDTFVDFLSLLDQHFRAEKGIDFYARNLKTTSRRLVALAKLFMGQPTVHLIEARCVSEARRELAFSNTPIQQIATDLGYADHSYFTKVFRKATGETPSHFRQSRAHGQVH